MNATAYTLPKDTYTEWAGYASRSFAPTARQQLVLDAVSQSLAEGLHYTDAVKARCAELLTPGADVLAVGTARVEGGEFGMDCYYARRALDAIAEHKRNDEAARLMSLAAGVEIGTVIFNNDFKRCYKTTVVDVSTDSVKLEFTRCKNRYQITAPPVSVRFAIERAYERKARKDSFQQFAASRIAG